MRYNAPGEGLARRWINGPLGRGEGRKVSVLLCYGRDGPTGERGCTFPLVVFSSEKEELVLAFIEHSWNPQRPAKIPAEVVVAQGRFNRGRRPDGLELVCLNGVVAEI